MPVYRVEVREVWVRAVEIEAESPDDAIRRADSGEGTEFEKGLEYSHTLKTDTWTVTDENGEQVR